ncbi:carbamoyltransferase HypF [Geitlerinema sp. PCC 9228]|uniref:carbamoyltransferase HypF n=1 Tax=Geitlerinema sp. PCC 9228 TaxID=111611 RepID=UPI0008F9C8B9|nr:carbamoyltransferase HypF [Geitlerinema sp. PCC 9228]
MAAEEIRIFGTVQGVGFRPTVYRFAKACSLTGQVWNDGSGVVIRVRGSQGNIDRFLQQLQWHAPPLAKIDRIHRQPDTSNREFNDFTIAGSQTTSVRTAISGDAATCDACLQETFDPNSRWYRYPFTNCTHCGPRLSIVQGIPYDRVNTSMAVFPMCADCQREYYDVENRRFHAQPIACPVCGPQIWLENAQGEIIFDEAIATTIRLIQQGYIVAMKGLGGFHLAVDATNERAVQTLRQRKKRDRKPFALMVRDLQVLANYCSLSAGEKELLQSPAAPIVLLAANGYRQVAPSVAPGQNRLGVMLPYTPLHHLIWSSLEMPVVLTSGNISDEPQCIDNQEAREKLSSQADFFLLHNRDIVNRVDDSVVRVFQDAPMVLRRARGYAPSPISLPPGLADTPPLLAMGGELKSTFCLVDGGKAILSQHLGDLENAAAWRGYGDTLQLYLQLFRCQPQAIAVDEHPEYLASKWGRDWAAADALPLYTIQHHHAHIGAVMAENHLPVDTPPVLGVAWDGLGYGSDGTFWGGEFLLADYHGFQRLASLPAVPLLGGEKAMSQPWRNTYAHLRRLGDWEGWERSYGDLAIVQFLGKQPRQLLDQMASQGINAPLASSAGRLFDAVAAAIGICREVCQYEGQAAVEMEACIDAQSWDWAQKTGGYRFRWYTIDDRTTQWVLDPQPMWWELLADCQIRLSPAVMAAKFHVGLARAIAFGIRQISDRYKFSHVAFSGGVWQNQRLLEAVCQQLQRWEIPVLTHHQIPPNDGGLSLGQAAIAAARWQH